MLGRNIEEDALCFNEPLDLTTRISKGSSDPSSFTSEALFLSTEFEQAANADDSNPAQNEVKFGVFVRKLTEELLDHRLPITQQPCQNLVRIESACRRAFPQYDARQIRLKIRAQLKLYRRQVKKSADKSKSTSKQTHIPRTLLPAGHIGAARGQAFGPSVELPVPVLAHCSRSPLHEAHSITTVNASNSNAVSNVESPSIESNLNIQGDVPIRPSVVCVQEPRTDECREHDLVVSTRPDGSSNFITTMDTVRATHPHKVETRNGILDDSISQPPNLLATSLRMSAGVLLQTAKLFEIAGLTAATTNSLRYPIEIPDFLVPRTEGSGVSRGLTHSTFVHETNG